MASRYSSNIRTGGVVLRYLFIWQTVCDSHLGIGFFSLLLCWFVHPILLHVEWAGIFSIVFASLPIWRSFVGILQLYMYHAH